MRVRGCGSKSVSNHTLKFYNVMKFAPTIFSSHSYSFPQLLLSLAWANQAPNAWRRGGGDSTKMWLMSPSSTVLEHKQDVFIRPIAAPRILKIAEAGAAHSWKTMQDYIKLQTCMLLKQCSTIIKGYTSSSARVLMISWWNVSLF